MRFKKNFQAEIKMKLSARVKNWLLIGYCLAVLFLSVAAINGTGALNKTKVAGLRSDYLLHALMFIPFMALVLWRWGGEIRNNARFFIALGAGLALAAVSEGVQWFLPYRTFNLLDLGANCLGMAIGALLAGCGRRKATG
jgi:VanZ family protein